MSDERHEDISMLLPWYVNGTLQAAERAFVERHLAQCGPCREEAAGLRTLAAVVQSDAHEPRFDLYARTLSQIDRAEAARPWSGIRALLTPVPRFALATMAAQLIVIAALAIALTGRAYTTLSNDPGPTVPSAELQVVFAESASAAEIRSVLLAANAQIIDGPTSSGVYRIMVTLGASRPTAQEILQRLRTSSAIEFAEIVTERP